MSCTVPCPVTGRLRDGTGRYGTVDKQIYYLRDGYGFNGMVTVWLRDGWDGYGTGILFYITETGRYGTVRDPGYYGTAYCMGRLLRDGKYLRDG